MKVVVVSQGACHLLYIKYIIFQSNLESIILHYHTVQHLMQTTFLETLKQLRNLWKGDGKVHRNLVKEILFPKLALTVMKLQLMGEALWFPEALPEMAP